MSVQALPKIFPYRSSDTVALLGSARSINTISEEEWKLIRQCDSFALNNWVYHPFFVPDMYMIEVKHYDYSIMQRRLAEKWEAYRRCRFIFETGRRIKFPGKVSKALLKLVPREASIFEVTYQKRNPKRLGVIDANYELHPHYITKSCQASVTAALEILWRMGYQTIILYGMDFYHSFYFWWDGDPKYGEVHHHTNKEHEGKDPNEPYATFPVKDFIVDFSKRWMWSRGRKLYVASTDSLLYPHIPLIDWSSHVI